MLFNNILAKCEKKGISVTRLEKALNFGNGTIHSWKTCSPSIEKAKLVADYFGCTVDDLLKEDG